MFSPHDSPAVKDWFQRFDAASRRLPAGERASQREEIQQHLEGLVAAKIAQGQPIGVAWEAATRQFGDPTQIGRKMYQEWQQGHSWLRSDVASIFCATSISLVMMTLGSSLLHLWVHSHGWQSVTWAIRFPLSFGVTATAGLVIGLQYPLQALKATFYGVSLIYMWTWATWLLRVAQAPIEQVMQVTLFIGAAALYAALWIAISVGAAYLASVTKRGWYRPSLADFKLTLPRKRRQTV